MSWLDEPSSKLQGKYGAGAEGNKVAAQVKAALGPELEKVAHKADMTADAAGAKFAEIMPELVDKLTPDGIVPKVAELRQNVGQLAAKLTHKEGKEDRPA